MEDQRSCNRYVMHPKELVNIQCSERFYKIFTGDYCQIWASFASFWGTYVLSQAIAPVLSEYLRCCCIGKATVLISWSLPSYSPICHIASCTVYRYTTIFSLSTTSTVASVASSSVLKPISLQLFMLLPPQGCPSLILSASSSVLSNCSCFSLLKAAHPKRLPDKVQAGPDVPPSTMI
jgi:hypothetical protein